MSEISSPEIHRSLGLTDDEMEAIRSILGREPTIPEIAMYSVMWSEHCSYKSSRIHLRKLPSDAPWVVVGPGENAGVVDLGDGIVAALRIESHNHPSAVEPFQGAATGVGGIVRDILSMGARPVLLGDPLRFGPLRAGPTPLGDVTEEQAARNRFLLKQVVAGISHYGNAVGVPTVGGEIGFAPCFSGNPLVNVFCLGLAHSDQIQRAQATNPGDAVVLLGASTGRDGIGGVSLLASAGFDEDSKGKRPAVQVGDPFEEKKLIEACLEIFRQGLATAIQDLGGAGISCAASETAARGGTGVEIDVSRIHRREPGMTPEEVMTSESQERMFLTVPPRHLEAVLEVASKWGIRASVIGSVVDGGELTVREGDKVVASVPAASLANGPRLQRPSSRPERLDRLWSDDVARLAPGPPDDEALMAIVSDPSHGDKSWIWRQYDHQLFVNTVAGPGGEAAVIRVRIPDDAIDMGASGNGLKSGAKTKGLAVAFEGGGLVDYLDPHTGAMHVVARVCRKLACVGARPLALVDCLNFGNPENPEIMWEFEQSIDGIAEACTALEVPVVGGNVSFYNETAGEGIWPTPILGAVGIIENLRRQPPNVGFFQVDLAIGVLGRLTECDLAGSAYAWTVLAHQGGRPPAIDVESERRLHAALSEAVAFLDDAAEREGLRPSQPIAAIHDLAEGGLGVALAESCVVGGIGATVDLGPLVKDMPEGAFSPTTVALFSETPGRVLFAVPAQYFDAVCEIARRHGLHCLRLGTTGGDSLRIVSSSPQTDSSSQFEVGIDTMTRAWKNALPSFLESPGQN
jgi:phosphoribosylformylglycinamidine synthase II